MFSIFDKFKAYDENRIPYTFSVERHTETENLHAGVTEEGFSLKSIGNRFILNSPEFLTGRFSMNFKITFPYEINPAFSVILGYDKTLRKGKSLRFVYDTKGEVKFFTADVKNNKYEKTSEEKTAAIDISDECFHSLGLLIGEKKLKVLFDDKEFEFDYVAQKGGIALDRDNFIGELIIKDFDFSSEEEFSQETVLKETKVYVPCINGGDIPYEVTYKIKKIEDEYYVTASLSGGTKTRKVNREDRKGQYAIEMDDLTNPYIAIANKDCDAKFNMLNGTSCFVDPNLYWECQKKLFGDTEIPITNCYKLSGFIPEKDFELVFGYEMLSCKGYRMQRGEHEFRYNQKGELVYHGAPINGKDFFEVTSPEDKFALSLIPENCYKKEEIIDHLKNNHYFETREPLKLGIEFYTTEDAELFTCGASVLNVYESKTLESVPLKLNTKKWIRNYNKLYAEASFKNLPVGVYKIEFILYYGGAKYKRIVKAFEVFNKDTDECPPLASGLPFMFSMNNEHKWLMRNAFDLWVPNHSYDMGHYIACATDTPIEAETRKVWEILKPFKRKWFAWLAIRTCNDYLSEKHNETIKNADYLFHTGRNTDYDNLGVGGLFPGRHDLFSYDSHKPIQQRYLMDDFLDENPEFSEKVMYKAGSEKITKEEYEDFMMTCGKEYIKYVNGILLETVKAHNRELEKLNPDVKRAIYGPFPSYFTPTQTANSLKYFSVPCNEDLSREYFSGFAIFEDYPYSCSYQPYRGTFAISTILLNVPDLVVYPEQYTGSIGGCIDGAVKFAHAPMGAYENFPYRNSTHAFEYVYNTAHRLPDGYHYWSTYGFHRPVYLVEFMEELIRDWEYVLENKPRKPLKSIGFIAEYDGDSDVSVLKHIDGRKECLFDNKSEKNQTIVFECARNSGVPNGFVMKFDTLNTLSKDECDVLVLPSLKGVEEKHINKIRELFKEGVNLIATSDVTGLEDLFGVRKNETETDVTFVEANGEKEYIYETVASFLYEPQNAETILSANGVPAVLKTQRTALVNTSVISLGCAEQSKMVGTKGKFIVGKLIRKILTDIIKELSRPLCKGENVGITLFETQKGEIQLLAINYTPFDNRAEEEKQAIIKVHMPEITDAESAKDMLVAKKDGRVCELRFNMRPYESVFVKLKK